MAVPEITSAPSAELVLYDRIGRRRSPATLPGARKGMPPRNKGEVYDPDPPTVDEIVALLHACRSPVPASWRDYLAAERLRALILLLWGTGMRIGEALALSETDLDPGASSVLIRRGKGGKRRTVGAPEWMWPEITPWLELRQGIPPGPLFCVVTGPTAGQTWAQTQVRKSFRDLREQIGMRRRFAPHQLRHCFAVAWVRRGGRIELLSRQLGHEDIATTQEYIRSIPAAEVVEAVRSWPMPTVAALGVTVEPRQPPQGRIAA